MQLKLEHSARPTPAGPVRPFGREAWLDPELDPLEVLACRAPRLADVVEAHSRRRDVRARRSRMLLMLLAMRCPPGSTPRQPWYVPGGVARNGPRGLATLYSRHFPHDPIGERRFRAHLTALENSLCIKRSPGDWMPTLDGGPPPRYADTIHILELDAEARFWAGPGAKMLRRHPEAKLSPTCWRRFFRDWRDAATYRQLELFPEIDPEPATVAAPLPAREAAALLRESVKSQHGIFDRLAALRSAGLTLRGRPGFLVASNERRLEGATALLAIALERGDRIRNRSGWLLRAFDGALDAELEDARRDVMRWEPPRIDSKKVNRPPSAANSVPIGTELVGSANDASHSGERLGRAERRGVREGIQRDDRGRDRPRGNIGHDRRPGGTRGPRSDSSSRDGDRGAAIEVGREAARPPEAEGPRPVTT